MMMRSAEKAANKSAAAFQRHGTLISLTRGRRRKGAAGSPPEHLLSWARAFANLLRPSIDFVLATAYSSLPSPLLPPAAARLVWRPRLISFPPAIVIPTDDQPSQVNPDPRTLGFRSSRGGQRAGTDTFLHNPIPNVLCPPSLCNLLAWR